MAADTALDKRVTEDALRPQADGRPATEVAIRVRDRALELGRPGYAGIAWCQKDPGSLRIGPAPCNEAASPARFRRSNSIIPFAHDHGYECSRWYLIAYAYGHAGKVGSTGL